VDVVSYRVARYLRAAEQNQGAAELEPQPDSVERMRVRGYLTRLSLDEEQQYFCKLADATVERRGAFQLCVDPQLRMSTAMPYCYQRSLQARGRKFTGRRLDEEQVDAAFTAMQRVQPDPSKVTGLTLLGGEPFQKENLQLVSHVVARAQQLGWR